jgi:hypothetical protein
MARLDRAIHEKLDSYEIRLNSSASVIPEAACGYPGSSHPKRRFCCRTPDKACGFSGVTTRP